MAALLGIDVDRTISITFVIAAALAAVAGTLYLVFYGVVRFDDGFVPGVKAFTAAVLGGIGSLPGAVLGGLLIGLIETLWAEYVSSAYKDVAAKYKGKADAEQKVYVHLTTNPKVKVDGKEESHDSLKTKNEADIRNVVRWILSR